MQALFQRLTTILGVVLFLQLSNFPIQAQFRAGLQGTVLDPNGGLIPDANVNLTSQETAVARNARTNGSGVFTISGLPPGRYTLTVEKEGFSKKVLSDLQIAAEQIQSVNVPLEVGQTTTSVTVDDTVGQIIDTQSAEIGGTLTSKDIANLPSFARDPYQLMRLAPGVFGDGALGNGGNSATMPGTNIGGSGATSSIFAVENGVQITANGTRQNSNNFQVDGVAVNSTSWGGAAVITPNEESVKEVRIVANNYSAENGRTSGAQVMVVSQNGTNDLHGSAFFKWHRPGLNAYQRWNGPGTPSPVQRDPNRFNQYGGSIGGPFWKNKLFGFFSYETLRNNSQTLNTAWYETDEFLQSAGRSNSIARQLLSFPGVSPSFVNQIAQTCGNVGLPSSQCRDTSGGLDLGSPMSTPLGTRDASFGQAGTPYGIGGGFDGIPDARFLQTTGPNDQINEQYNGRADFNPTDADRIAFSIYWVPTESHSFNGPARSSNAWNHLGLASSWTAIYTRTFGPTWINEARVGASGWNWNEFDSNPQAPWGLPTANISSFGGVALQNFGAPGFSIFDQKTYNYRDTLTKVHGSHFLRFGADVSHALFLDTAPWSARPTYEFRNLWDFANDAPFKESANFDPKTGTPTAAEKNLRFNIIGLFIQDDWKVKPNLTLNLGLRWEYFGPLTETKNNISNVILGTGSSALTDLRINQGGSLFGTSLKNFGPQVGLTWTPARVLGRDVRDKLVFRGGFGIGYNLQQLAVTSNGRFNPPFLTSLDLFDNNVLYSTNSDVNSFIGWPSNPNAVQTFDPVSGLPTSGAPVNLTAFPTHMPSTTTYRYSFDMQMSLGRGWAATLGYQGSQSRHYTIQNNLNYLFYPNVNPRVQTFSYYSNDANAHYNALLAQVQQRMSRTFSIDFQYRFSRNIDYGTQDYFMDMYPWKLTHAKGPSDFDVTHNFKLWGVWTPQFFRGRSQFVRTVLDGWTLSSIVTFHTGFPFTPRYCNTAGNVVYPNSGYGCLYPSSYGGGAGGNYSNSTFQQSNGNFAQGALAYFTVPTWPATGIPPEPADSIHRGAFRGPRYLGNDFTLAKAFGLPKMPLLGENAKLNLQANFYNLFNKLNLLPIGDSSNQANLNISNDGVTSNPQFGQSLGALAGRIIELQARFSF